MIIQCDSSRRQKCHSASRSAFPIADVREPNDSEAMRALLLPILAAAAPVPADHPRTYLLSVADLPLKAGESVESFKFSTWGVEHKAVCHIPSGWRVTAGSSATPNGSLEASGSQGATWFTRGSPPELRHLVLVTLDGAVQRTDRRSSDGNGLVPATFSGRATISTDDGERKVLLNYRNVILVPARRCRP